ncbi:translation initiation factor IF-5A [Candidatus Woesearchaeota archaeon]|jgi:translation initiation factor 5A|nr:translation initiation factor IF-5A [Candidatus Woesearchaeota archaeon]MBT7237401.1 translation initiation factor IF-5A [Candidatus Woesearchaeota archaeon]
MDKKLVHASGLKVGGFVIFDDKACKVTSIEISKTGKHGHAKARIAAVSITNGSKIIKVFPGHDKVEVPIIEKETAQVLSIAGDKANVMDMKSYETFDLDIPEDLKDQVKEGDQVNYWIILGKKVLRSK